MKSIIAKLSFMVGAILVFRLKRRSYSILVRLIITRIRGNNTLSFKSLPLEVVIGRMILLARH